MKIVDRAKNRAGTIGELFAFLRKRKLWWMIPMFVVLMIFAIVVVLAQGSPLAPFIYTLF